jgi:hypothetical protein
MVEITLRQAVMLANGCHLGDKKELEEAAKAVGANHNALGGLDQVVQQLKAAYPRLMAEMPKFGKDGTGNTFFANCNRWIKDNQARCEKILLAERALGY